MQSTPGHVCMETNAAGRSLMMHASHFWARRAMPTEEGIMVSARMTLVRTRLCAAHTVLRALRPTPQIRKSVLFRPAAAAERAKPSLFRPQSNCT